MSFFEIGGRDAVERAIRLLFIIPCVGLCPFLLIGLLRDRMAPSLLFFAIGGGIGGALGFCLSEGAIRLLRVVWPPKPKRLQARTKDT